MAFSLAISAGASAACFAAVMAGASSARAVSAALTSAFEDSIAASFCACRAAVSYTHLDVYKRQAMTLFLYFFEQFAIQLTDSH